MILSQTTKKRLVVRTLLISSLLSILVAEAAFATNFTVPPDPPPFTLLAGPPPDTLRVSPGFTANTLGVTVTMLGGNTVTNYGTISSTESTAIFVNASVNPGAPGLMLINNFGTISGITAIDLSGTTGDGGQINHSGLIDGNVLLPTNSNSVFTITGGGRVQGFITQNPGTGISNLFISTSFTNQETINNISNIYVDGPQTAGVPNTFTVNTNISGFNIFTNAFPSLTIINGATVSGNILNNFGVMQFNSGAIVVNNLINSGTLTINGGTINGNIVGYGQNSVLNINGSFTNSNAPITNVANINVQAGSFTIVKPVIGYNTLINNSTININGGYISGGITPMGTSSVVNINTAFTTAGPIGAANINVNPGASFTVFHPLYASNALTVGPTASMRLNNSVAGTVINNGNMILSGPVSITGNFVQSNSGTFTTILGASPSSPFGSIQVGGTANLGGSVQVILPPDGGISIPNNAGFDIVKANGGAFSGNPTIIQPTSTVLSFVLTTPNATTLRLIAKRLLLQNITGNSPLVGVADALETIRADTPTTAQRALLRALDSAPNLAAVQSDLSQLVPITNGGTVYTLLQTQQLNFDKISMRLDSLQAGVDDTFKTSYVAGDRLLNAPSIGPYFFGNTIKQNRQDNFDGFSSTTGGVGILGDTPLGCFLKVGGAFSYATSTVKVDNNIGNQTLINTVQGTVYGRIEYGWPFAEVMYSLGHNNFRTRRNIIFMQQVANANFHGDQQAGKVRAGVMIPIGTLELTPQAWWVLTRLHSKQYGETGAPGANLTVVGNVFSVVDSAYGLRFAEISEPDVFYPEIHVMGITFNKAPNFATTALFTDSGPAFLTPGPSARKTGVNIGGSITARLSEGFVIIGAYDYAGRKNFNSHSLALKLRYFF